MAGVLVFWREDEEIKEIGRLIGFLSALFLRRMKGLGSTESNVNGGEWSRR